MNDASGASTATASPVELESLSVRLALPCPTCSRSNPIHDLVPSAHCFSCGGKVSTKRAWHEADVRKESIRLLSGLQKTGDHPEAHPQIALQAPTCSCGAPLSIPSGGVLGPPEGNLNCHKCGATFQICAASEEARALAGLPELRYVVREVLRDTASAEAHPTALKCSNCGALLHTNGHQRVVQCEFCHASVEMPESMWVRPGSAPRALPFYLLVEPDPRTRTERHYRESSLEVRAHDAQSPQTSTLALEVLSTMHRPRDLPLLVAQNPSTPEAVLIQLAKSDSEKVRLAVLARFERDGGSAALEAAVAPIREAQKEAHAQQAAAMRGPQLSSQPTSRSLALDSSWGKTPEEQRANVIGAIVAISVGVVIILIFSWLIIFHPKNQMIAHSRIVPVQTHVVGSAK